MNTYLHIVIQFSDMSEPKNNCSVLTVATFNFIEEDGQKKKEEVHKDKVKESGNKEDDGITQGKFLMLLIVWFSIF